MESSKGKQRGGLVTGRPWWCWNLITLTVTLFVLIWVREIGKIPLSMTWTMVVTVFGVWYLVPAFLTGRIPWPLSYASWVESETPGVPASGLASWATVLCRVAAVALALGAMISAGWYFSMLVVEIGSFERFWAIGLRRGYLSLAELLSGFWPSIQAAVMALGLWAIADISNALRSLSDLYAYERRKDAMRLDERSSSGREALHDGTDSTPQGFLKPDNRQGR